MHNSFVFCHLFFDMEPIYVIRGLIDETGKWESLLTAEL